MSQSGFNFDDTYTKLASEFFTALNPEPVLSPEVVVMNEELASSIGLDFSGLSAKEQAALFSGNELPEGASPFAQAYAGHQFGHFTMLGDGRAHILGEHITPEQKRLDIQFKGSGRTPYSRSGDGRAVLGPMLREYVISEALHSLGIPTTRSLAVVTTGEEVLRESLLPGSILTRVASSHIRVGTFEFAAEKLGVPGVKSLSNYTIERHYPEVRGSENEALALLNRVIERQADLIVHWMRVGFIHGVMNTDNMTLSGESIDFGPCAFMDAYDPATVFSSIDRRGRYAYSNQPRIAQWNLARLAEALLPLIADDIETAAELAEDAVQKFSQIFQQKWIVMMKSKLGLLGTQEGDEQLITDFLRCMQESHADYTNTFHALSAAIESESESFVSGVFDGWYAQWKARLSQCSEPIAQVISEMNQVNPAVIPRNHKVEEALEAATEGDLSVFKSLLEALKEPYEDRESLKPYQDPPQPSDQVYQTFCGT